MRIQPSLGSVIGVADSNHWGQVFLSPTAYGVVEVCDPSGRARDLGVHVLGRLSEQTATPPRSVKRAQEIALNVMDHFISSLILLVPKEAALLIVLLGEGSIWVKRNGRLAMLMDKPGAICGDTQEGDTFIIMSRSVRHAFSRENLVTLFDHLDARSIAEKMIVLLHKHEDGKGGSALVFQVKGLRQKGEDRLTETWRRPVVLVTALIAALFFISVALGIRKQMSKRASGDVARVLSDAQHAFSEGVALFELNPAKGRERLRVAREALAPLTESLAPSSVEGKAVARLYKDIVDQLTTAMQVLRAEPALFYDLSLLKENGAISSIGQNSDTVALLDANALTVATLTVQAKNGRIVAGAESYRGASLLTMHGDSVFVLVDGGIHRAFANERKTTPLVVKKDEQWGNISSLVSYGGNLYLLDTGKSRIWKYVATDVGFSQTREYLNPDTLPDLSQATGMAIDGGVWVGTRDGRILRFVQGREETFVPRGVEPSFGTTLVVATTEEDKNLYILDSDNKRVVVLDKDGVYLAQYVWTGNLLPSQLVVSEKLKLMLLLADGKLYSIELK